MMKGKKGNNDGFPPIPGMIARYSALGLTNEETESTSKNLLTIGYSGNSYTKNCFQKLSDLSYSPFQGRLYKSI